jgi:CRISPR-associated endoribonuclease Cas6
MKSIDNTNIDPNSLQVEPKQQGSGASSQNPAITQIEFDLMPTEECGTQFLSPYCYIFRGIIMDWIDNANHALATELHSTQPIGGGLFLREYAIQHERLSLTSSGLQTQAEARLSPNYREDRRSAHQHADRMPNGIRFRLNSLDGSMSDTLLKLLLVKQDQTVQFGAQKALITSIKITRKSAKDFQLKSKLENLLGVRFTSPTSFNVMDRDYELRFPLPEYVFGNLLKQWNQFTAGTPFEMPKELYDWIKLNVSITSYDLKTVGWEMGKPKKFVGCIGWAKYLIKKANPKEDPQKSQGNHKTPDDLFAQLTHQLILFGEYANVGMGRSAGFGQLKVMGERGP